MVSGFGVGQRADVMTFLRRPAKIIILAIFLLMAYLKETLP